MATTQPRTTNKKRKQETIVEHEKTRPTLEELNSLENETISFIHDRIFGRETIRSTGTTEKQRELIHNFQGLNWKHFEMDDLIEIIQNHYGNNEIVTKPIETILRLRLQSKIPKKIVPGEEISRWDTEEQGVSDLGPSKMELRSVRDRIDMKSPRNTWEEFTLQELNLLAQHHYKLPTTKTHKECVDSILNQRKRKTLGLYLKTIAIDRLLRNQRAEDIPLARFDNIHNKSFQEELEPLSEKYETLFSSTQIQKEIDSIQKIDPEIFIEQCCPIVIKPLRNATKIHTNLTTQIVSQRLKKLLPGLDTFHWRPEFVLAGGSVMSLIHNTSVNDLDFFMIQSTEIFDSQTGKWNEEEATKIAIQFLRDLWRTVLENHTQFSGEHPKYVWEDMGPYIIKNGQSFNITLPNNVHVQVILRLYTNVAEILTGFDIPFCQAAISNNPSIELIMTFPCVQSFISRVIYIDGMRCSSTYWNRIQKYIQKYDLSLIVPSVHHFFVPFFKNPSNDLYLKSDVIRMIVKPETPAFTRATITQLLLLEKDQTIVKTSDYDAYNLKSIERMLKESYYYLGAPWCWGWCNAILVRNICIPRLIKTPPELFSQKIEILDLKYIEAHLIQINTEDDEYTFHQYIPLENEDNNEIVLSRFLSNVSSRMNVLSKYQTECEKNNILYYGGPHIIKEIQRLVDFFQEKQKLFGKSFVSPVNWRTVDPGSQTVSLISGSFDPRFSSFKEMTKC
jgi:hypothetical protein